MGLAKKGTKILYFPSADFKAFPASNSSNHGKGGSNRLNKNLENKRLYPIDRRLRELGKSRRWLTEQVQRSPQCIGNYCNRKIIIKPDSLLTRRICKVLAVDLNYLILGRSHFQAQDFSQKL